jgi:hypothetical protein
MKPEGHCDRCGELAALKLYWHYLCEGCAHWEEEEFERCACTHCKEHHPRVERRQPEINAG